MKDFEFQPESNSGTLLGGVRLPRELTDLSVWQKKPFDPAHALVDLYMVANNTSGTFTNQRKITIDYEAGEILHTAKGLADRWGWKRESVEKFLVELEKSEIIRRRPIAQYGQVIKLIEFDTNPDSKSMLNSNPAGHPTGQPEGHRAGHPTGHGKDSGGDTVGEGVGDWSGEGVGEGAPPRIVTLAQAQKYFAENESGYTPDQVREQWLYYDAQRDPKTGEWQKPRGHTGTMVRITDWRSELANALLKFADKKTGGTSGHNGGLSANVQAIQDQTIRRTLTAELTALEDEVHQDRTGNLPVDPEKKARLKKLRAEVAALQPEVVA